MVLTFCLFSRYTSLGSTHDTFPNPALRNENEQALWKPAWMLEDESKERLGRETSQSQSSGPAHPKLPAVNGLSRS